MKSRSLYDAGMGTTKRKKEYKRTRECERIEPEVRLFAPAGFEIECLQEFDTKDYRIWLTKDSQSHPVDISLEHYQDRDWRGKVKAAIEDFELILSRRAKARGSSPATAAKI